VTLTFADKIDPVAIYAATISTIVLLWQIFVWFRTGPRLKISVSSNMKTFGALEDGNTYIVANVVNTGTQPTTIPHVVGYAYRNRLIYILGKPSNTFWVKHSVATYPIPYPLEVGKTFMSMMIQEETIEQLSRDRLLYFGVVHAFGKTPVIARVRPIRASRSRSTT